MKVFVDRTACWHEIDRIALNVDQITEYNLPPMPGKAGDSRAQGFVERHGELMQVELDALPPDVLRSLYQDAIARWWDDAAYAEIMEQEDEDTQSLIDGL